eukprot:10532482-Lingulodinium_polyedra.AAC.1
MFESRDTCDQDVHAARGVDDDEATEEAPDLSRPWAGEDPPKGGHGFVRRKDGIWCRPDSSGRLYKVDALGERWYNPKS